MQQWRIWRRCTNSRFDRRNDCKLRICSMGQSVIRRTNRPKHSRSTDSLCGICLRYRNKAVLFTSTLLCSGNSTFYLTWPWCRKWRRTNFHKWLCLCRRQSCHDDRSRWTMGLGSCKCWFCDLRWIKSI